MFSLTPPSVSQMKSLRESWTDEPLSYRHRGGIEHPPETGFIHETHRVCLGRGPETYHRACAALDAWMMFPEWAVVHRPVGLQQPGQIVAMVVRILGLWWINPCRVLVRCDAENRHGFVYGTLPEHAECGEERFMVERLPDDSVWYEIQAFSRPRNWMTWIGFPLARWWQLRFVRDSHEAMKNATRSLPA